MTDGVTARQTIAPRLLVLVPALTYLMSYLYLALYHGRLWLWPVVVHESGRYTLLETTFYASHFLGHVPVLVTIAFLLAGSWLCMSPGVAVGSASSLRWLAVGLMVLLAASVAISLAHFGSDDTLSFVLQLKQRPDLYTEGGAWNLHLPSTMLQVLLIPCAVWAARCLAGRPVVWSGRGIGLLATAAVILVAMTWLANARPPAAVAAVWSDPRYLAHSVRELATFPLTYYPIPLAVLLWRERPRAEHPVSRRLPEALIATAAVVFVLGFSVQVWISLANDVGSLAQRPAFARGGELSIPYLLASHSFEHVLDSIFFALVALLLVRAFQPGSEEAAGCREP